jgi:TATA-binding protein-associated factor Taf7
MESPLAQVESVAALPLHTADEPDSLAPPSFMFNQNLKVKSAMSSATNGKSSYSSQKQTVLNSNIKHSHMEQCTSSPSVSLPSPFLLSDTKTETPPPKNDDGECKKGSELEHAGEKKSDNETAGENKKESKSAGESEAGNETVGENKKERQSAGESKANNDKAEESKKENETATETMQRLMKSMDKRAFSEKICSGYIFAWPLCTS